MLAAQDVCIRYFGTAADRTDLAANGIDWIPKEYLRPEVALTRSLSARISTALAALEELGYVRRIGTPARFVKVTRKGLTEAGSLSRHHGNPRSAYKTNVAAIRRTLDKQATTGEHIASLSLRLKHVEDNPYGPPEEWRAWLRWARSRLRDHPDDLQLAELLPKLEHAVQLNRRYEVAMNDLRIARFVAALEMLSIGDNSWGTVDQLSGVVGMDFYRRRLTFRFPVIPTFPTIPDYPMPPEFEGGHPGPATSK